jgi:hypothetical protein
MRALALALLLAAAGPLLAADEWPLVPGASVAIGSETLPVYRDPKNPGQYLIRRKPGCYLINMKDQRIFLPNCAFRESGKSITLDPGWRNDKGQLEGVSWGDAKTEISFWSLIFRRPRFSETSVEFYDEGTWFKVTGLPQNGA